MKSTRETERKVNAIVEEILDEDEEDEDDPCPGGCDQLNNTATEASPSQEVGRQCKCAVENSWRFSLRVMEAMRSLQRDPDQPSTSTAEDIVEHIRTNYRSDGDLYAQVRTALRQVCSQGFVVELLENEYHLIGPVARSTRPSGCSSDCKGRVFSTTDDTRRRRRSVNNREADACRCRHSPRRNGPRKNSRSPREHVPRESTLTDDQLEDLSAEDILHSTVKLTNDERLNTTEESQLACVCEDIPAARKERHPRRDDNARVHEAEYASPIPGPSRVLQRVTPTKKARVEDRETFSPRHAVEENDEETTTEEEEVLDCICDTVSAVRETQARKQPRDRTPRVVMRDRNKRRKKVKEDDEENEVAEEEDEDEDSVYRRLRQRDRRKRSATREEELRRWIRRCREECERRAKRDNTNY